MRNGLWEALRSAVTSFLRWMGWEVLGYMCLFAYLVFIPLTYKYYLEYIPSEDGAFQNVMRYKDILSL